MKVEKEEAKEKLTLKQRLNLLNKQSEETKAQFMQIQGAISVIKELIEDDND